MSFRPIAVGEGDIGLERELAQNRMPKLKPDTPPVQSVYVCGWCYSIVDLCSLNWADDSVYVCDKCAEKHFSKIS